MWIIVLLIIVVVIVAVVKSGSSSNSATSDDAALLFAYYESIRNYYHDESRSSSIIVGSPVLEYDGTTMLSGFLAVYVSEDDNSGSAKANSLGMKTRVYNGKFEHQFVIEKRFSKQEKRQLLQAVGNKIQEVYPNDFLNYDYSLPLLVSLVEMKDFVGMIQNEK